MILEYTLSGRQRRKYVFFPFIKLFVTIIIFTIIGVVWFDFNTEEAPMVIGLAWLCIFLIHVLPMLIMAIRHTQFSNDSYFAIDTVNKTYQYKEMDRSLSFRVTEIDKVIKVVSPPKYDKRWDIMGFGYFFYWKIILVDGRILSISCMLLDAEDFSGKEVIQEKRMFPIPRSNEYIMAQCSTYRG